MATLVLVLLTKKQIEFRPWPRAELVDRQLGQGPASGIFFNPGSWCNAQLRAPGVEKRRNGWREKSCHQTGDHRCKFPQREIVTNALRNSIPQLGICRAPV